MSEGGQGKISVDHMWVDGEAEERQKHFSSKTGQGTREVWGICGRVDMLEAGLYINVLSCLPRTSWVQNPSASDIG